MHAHEKGGVRDLLEKAKQQPARWLLVALGVAFLLRLKLVLFAAALPVMAYWHYSNQAEEPADAEPEPCDEDADADLDPPWLPEEEMDGAGAHREGTDSDAPFGLEKEDGDPYEGSFWGAANTAEAPKRSTPWRNTSRSAPMGGSHTGSDNRGDDDDFGFTTPGLVPRAAVKDVPPPEPRASGAPWEAGDPLDLGSGLPGASGKGPGRGMGSERGGPFGGGDEADPLDGLGLGLGDDGGLHGPGLGADLGLGLAGDDMELFGASFGGGSKGRGKGKGKPKGGDKGGPRDPMAPREANPKQVFVANVGDLQEETIRTFFEDVGEVDRLKVLRNPDGGSKGVCFVTFRTEEQAQKALTLHGRLLEGKHLVVRLAHAGNKGGDKGGERGGKGGGPDRFQDRFSDRAGTPHEGLPDLGGSERFGPAFGHGDGDRDRGDRGGGFGKGGRGGRGAGGGRRGDRGEMDDLLEEALADSDGPIKPADFDFAARRFLAELRSRDRTDGTSRFQEALDMVLRYTASKDRLSVRKWPAYIFTLLQKFDSQLGEELRERDAERRREKGGGGHGAARERRPLD